ncbi:MAG: CvpA family protein [Muribaculaceae bacterium]|nr:CvpA family protein [Muribaculaceae bacterium]
MTNAQIISWVLIFGTVAYAAYGAWRGAVRQAASVLAFLIGFLGARLFAPSIAYQLHLPSFFCFALVYALFFTGVMILARVLRMTVRMLLLGPLDRMAGAIIGAIKWLLLTSLLINLLILCAPDSGLFAAPFSRWVANFAPRLFGLALNIYQSAS